MLSVYYGKLEKNHQRPSENIFLKPISKCNNNHFLTDKPNLTFHSLNRQK